MSLFSNKLLFVCVLLFLGDYFVCTRIMTGDHVRARIMISVVSKQKRDSVMSRPFINQRSSFLLCGGTNVLFSRASKRERESEEFC